jgi:hypothetical protein
MNRITWGFWLAAVYNSFIVVFSKGFGEDLGAVDPLFGSTGCVAVLLWGAAYFALGRRYDVAPAVAAVFCVEKGFYGVHWLVWMSAHSGKLPTMVEQDPLTGLFFSIYGIGDLLFMLFFGFVAWKWRHNISGETAS